MTISNKNQKYFFWFVAMWLVLVTTSCQIEIKVGEATAIQNKSSPLVAIQPNVDQNIPRSVSLPSPSPSPTNWPSPTAVVKTSPAIETKVSPTPLPKITSSVSIITSTATITVAIQTRSTPLPPPPPTSTLIIPAYSPPDHISAPAIGLDAPVARTIWTVVDHNGTQTSAWVIPDDAAGWHENSALPGHGSNVVLSGHHNLGIEVFRNLVDLEQDDKIILRADNRDYYYVVTDRFILPERNVSEEQRRQNAQWIMPTADERITLVTCWPYNDNSHRLIVIAKPLIGG